MTRPDLPLLARDPDGRTVVFDQRAWEHIETRRPELLAELDQILGAIRQPDHREPDPEPGRERYYLARGTDRIRWLRVVVDFKSSPAVVVTAFVQRKRPT